MRICKGQSLLELEVRAPHELGAIVREALSNIVLSPMWQIAGKRGDVSLLKTSMVMDGKVDSILSEIEQALRRVEEKCPSLAPIPLEIRVLEADEHATGRQGDLQPRRVSPRLALCLPSHSAHADQGQKLLFIDPQEAFGDGNHPSTRLALQLTDRLLSGHYGPPPRADEWVLDAGCGTGVLALAAAVLGDFRVLAVDLDSRAIDAARVNLRLNPEPGSRIFLTVGDLPCARGPFCLVLANLVPTVQARAHETLWPAVAPGGWVVLSGFCESHRDSVLRPYVQRGAVEKAYAVNQTWVGTLLRKGEEKTL